MIMSCDICKEAIPISQIESGEAFKDTCHICYNEPHTYYVHKICKEKEDKEE